jgi:hypothetical protein
MRSLTTLTVCAALALAAAGCGSSTDDSSTPTPTQTSNEGSTPAQEQAATQVCDARADIKKQVQTLTSLSTENATIADITSAVTAITSDLQTMKAAQADLAPERKQQVSDAAAAFETELKDLVKETVRGSGDAKTQAESAASSLEAAVKKSLEPIAC